MERCRCAEYRRKLVRSFLYVLLAPERACMLAFHCLALFQNSDTVAAHSLQERYTSLRLMYALSLCPVRDVIQHLASSVHNNAVFGSFCGQEQGDFLVLNYYHLTLGQT